ncbi:MAG TPA: primosomal protein N' [Candidatus Dependentiae bacterium]|nr:primosomal protein N' [Candidatus Dependentiae bacterium]HRQ63055.1 primosomal protein N' [Candidatus Dependentiae bacterium]
MFINVRLLNGFNEPLLYHIPEHWQQKPSINSIVHVPVRNQIVPAIVTQLLVSKPAHITFAIRDADHLEAFPHDTCYAQFIAQLAQYYALEPLHFVKRIKQFVTDTKKQDVEYQAQEYSTPALLDVQLTDEQHNVCAFLKPHITTPQYTPTVLHGVTGSGKTEVYKELIMHALTHNKSVLLLLPEVTLALAFAHRLKHELPDQVTLFSFHSAVGTKEKKQLWQALLDAQPVVIVGVHLPVLLPIANLGLIIVDEEHETGYQEKKHPKINSKEAAIMRAYTAGIPILLGSATPSIQTLHNVQQKNWHFFQLPKRFAGAFPAIKIVLLSDKKQRKNFWISQELQNAIKDRLQKKEQIIIFLNRRGFSFFVQCKQCSFIFSCHGCSVSLTLHTDGRLTCHYCDHKMLLPTACPTCHAGEHQFLKKGIGTQQVVSIIQQLFPEARIARADMDSTAKKKNWQETVVQFATGKIDILVGTQTITKGYDFPNVTLVGILWADLNLHFPIYNAAETTLQQLIQVAGRAGRQRAESLVIVQAMANHTIFEYMNEIDYIKFFTHVMGSRKMLGYPPYKRLVEIELKHTDELTVERDAHTLIYALQTNRSLKKWDLHILGPAKPPVHKIKNTYARKIYIKGVSMQEIVLLFASINHKKYKSSIYFCPNPVT